MQEETSKLYKDYNILTVEDPSLRHRQIVQLCACEDTQALD